MTKPAIGTVWTTTTQRLNMVVAHRRGKYSVGVVFLGHRTAAEVRAQMQAGPVEVVAWVEPGSLVERVQG